MAALSRNDFFKYENDEKKDRKLIILKMYKDQKAFTLKDDTNVVFKYEKSVYDKIASLKSGENQKDKNDYAAVVLTTTNNQRKKLTDLKKTKELGGGTGSGAGAENTKLNESSVCLWCAVYKEYGKADLSTVAKYYKEKKVKDSYIVDETDKNMISQSDELWLSHYERTAEFLIKGMFKQGDWIFHRGSELVDAINKKFSELNKTMEVPFSNINKWSPADIWVSKKGFKLDLDKCMTMDCLNKYLLNSLKDRELVGISLKKTVNTIHQTNFNVGEKRPMTVFTGYRLKAERGDTTILSSKDVYILGKGEDDITMQVRSFDTLSGFQGELIGKIAKYGKIAMGPMNQYLSELKLEKLPDQQSIVSRAKVKDEKLIKELYTMFKKHADPGVSQENFVATVKSTATKPDYLFSKYLGVKLIDIILSTTEEKRNRFVNASVGYGLSNTKNSAPFIKIS